MAVAIAGLALLPARPLLGAALGVGGILNVIQVGMGLVMFPELSGDAALGPVFNAVLFMAFFLFYAAKLSFGVAAVAIGKDLMGNATGGAKIVGVLAVIAGLAAIVLNAGAIPFGDALRFYAGGAGTAAALFLGLSLLMMPKTSAE